jgi:hypothetical protein
MRISSIRPIEDHFQLDKRKAQIAIPASRARMAEFAAHSGRFNCRSPPFPKWNRRVRIREASAFTRRISWLRFAATP